MGDKNNEWVIWSKTAWQRFTDRLGLTRTWMRWDAWGYPETERCWLWKRKRTWPILLVGIILAAPVGLIVGGLICAVVAPIWLTHNAWVEITGDGTEAWLRRAAKLDEANGRDTE